jgi:hypothetical protein
MVANHGNHWFRIRTFMTLIEAGNNKGRKKGRYPDLGAHQTRLRDTSEARQ